MTIFTYTRNEKTVRIYCNDANMLTFERYPDGTEWTEEEADAWGAAKVAFLQDPDNVPDATDGPKYIDITE